MNLILALTNYIDLEDWDLNCINKIAKTYDRVSKDIAF